MADEKNRNEKDEEVMKKDVDINDLEQVKGGSIKDVNYTPTTDISKDTKSKI